MKRTIALTILGWAWFAASTVMAQSYPEEALILSRTTPGGSARIQAMGGAQLALGGDISSAYANPAGLGMYNRSDVSLTLGLANPSFTSTYLGNNMTSSLSNFMIPNGGIAFHASQDGSSGFWGGTLGISYNRISNFNETFSYQGTNPDNSIIDYFITDANGNDTGQFGNSGFQYNTPTGLAYYNFLIGPQDILVPPGPSDQYFTDVTGIPQQSETVKNSGSQSQWNLSYGVNLNDKVFLGAGLGIVKARYERETTYTERFFDVGGPMSEMQLKENVTIDGTGINFTAGVIARPFSSLQAGLSISTPTAFEIDDQYQASMSTSWNNFVYGPGDTLNNESASTDQVVSTYSLSTPWKIGLGLAYFFGKHGFLTTDVEWLNYSKTRFSGESDWSLDNDDIDLLYRSVFNLRAGGEYRLNNYRFRAGYSYMPDPFKSPQNSIDRAIWSITTGVGYRVNKFYVDIAYIYSSGTASYNPYPFSPVVSQKKTTPSILLTVGFPF